MKEAISGLVFLKYLQMLNRAVEIARLRVVTKFTKV